MKITKFLTARSTVITLFSAISAALLIASAVPQRDTMGGKTPVWAEQLPQGLKFLHTLLGLDHVVGTGWFAALVALFWLSLLVSTVSQFSVTRSLVQRVPAPELPPGCTKVETSPEELAARLVAAGYHPAGSDGGVERYVKHKAGYWGNFMLHVGIVTAVVFALMYVVTQHRVMIRLTGEEILKLTPDTVKGLQGIFPVTTKLPHSVLLKSLQARHWPNDKLEYLGSELYFTDVLGGDPQRVDVALSDKSSFGPYLVYQANAYGRSFDVQLQLPDGVHQERLYLSYPSRRDAAGYGEGTVTGTNLVLKAKFYADPQHKSIQYVPGGVTLRLYRGKEFLGEAALMPGQEGVVAGIPVRVGQNQWWTDILLDGSRGTAGIFAGFAILLLGVLCSYCLVPREIILRRHEGSLYVQQVVRRFASFYREEYDALIHGATNPGES